MNMEKEHSFVSSKEDDDADSSDDDSGCINQVFKCSQCSKVFKHHSSLCRHEVSKCRTVKTFTCNGCDKSFDRHDSLTQHIAKSCKGKKRVWRCVNCSKEFQFNCHLQRHLKSCVNKCNTCCKKIESDGNHVCSGLRVKLPENSLKCGKKRKREEESSDANETSSLSLSQSSYSQPSSISQETCESVSQNLCGNISEDSLGYEIPPNLWE